MAAAAVIEIQVADLEPVQRVLSATKDLHEAVDAFLSDPAVQDADLPTEELQEAADDFRDALEAL